MPASHSQQRRKSAPPETGRGVFWAIADSGWRCDLPVGQELLPAAKAVLAAIAVHGENGNIIRLPIEAIAENAGVGVRHTKRMIKLLELAGFLLVVSRGAGDGPGAGLPNTYSVRCPRASSLRVTCGSPSKKSVRDLSVTHRSPSNSGSAALRVTHRSPQSNILQGKKKKKQQQLEGDPQVTLKDESAAAFLILQKVPNIDDRAIRAIITKSGQMLAANGISQTVAERATAAVQTADARKVSNVAGFVRQYMSDPTYQPPPQLAAKQRQDERRANRERRLALERTAREREVDTVARERARATDFLNSLAEPELELLTAKARQEPMFGFHGPPPASANVFNHTILRAAVVTLAIRRGLMEIPNENDH